MKRITKTRKMMTFNWKLRMDKINSTTFTLLSSQPMVRGYFHLQ